MLNTETIQGKTFTHFPIEYSTYLAELSATPADIQASKFGQAMFRNSGGREVYLPQIVRGVRANPAVPTDARDAAERYSRDLVFNLSAVVSRVERHKAHGSLDSSKLARLARPGISSHEFDRLAGSAFKARGARTANRRPRLAIVADMCWDLRSDNSEYGPNVSRLAYIMAEACKLAGMESSLILSRGNAHGVGFDWTEARNAGKRSHIPAIAKSWHDEITGPLYFLFNDNNAFITALVGMACEKGRKYGDGIGSQNGAGGVEFARLQGADFVIAIGKFPNDAAPDCLLGATDTIDAMVQKASDAFAAYSTQH